MRRSVHVIHRKEREVFVVYRRGREGQRGRGGGERGRGFSQSEQQCRAAEVIILEILCEGGGGGGGGGRRELVISRRGVDGSHDPPCHLSLSSLVCLGCEMSREG